MDTLRGTLRVSDLNGRDYEDFSLCSHGIMAVLYGKEIYEVVQDSEAAPPKEDANA